MEKCLNFQMHLPVWLCYFKGHHNEDFLVLKATTGRQLREEGAGEGKGQGRAEVESVKEAIMGENLIVCGKAVGVVYG